jgi:asparagine N-glycosylation enzyme membrane subunit Stt3
MLNSLYTAAFLFGAVVGTLGAIIVHAMVA